MCFRSFSSPVNALILLWLCGYLSDVFSFETTTESPCKGEAGLVCLSIVTQEDRRKALASAFSKNHEIDLIFIICNTTECTKAYKTVITFIQTIVALIFTQYDSYIDEDRMHIAIIVYDNTSARQTLNDIVEQIPKVGNCEFDKFLDSRTESSEARGDRHDGLLKESLDKANEIFSQSARPNARKILWLFSECGYCENADKRYSVEIAAGDIKRTYGDNVDVFTAGIGHCPLGWFATLAQENTMKTIASTNSSHYACIESWKEFTYNEINSGKISQHWSNIINDADIGQSCKDCANSTTSSSYRCLCEVASEKYECHDSLGSRFAPSKLAIALGVGFGGGLFVVRQLGY